MSEVGVEKKRTITIDPSMYSLSKKSKRNARSSKAAPIAPKPRPFIRPNTLKKTLLEKIKQHQQRKHGGNENISSPASPNLASNESHLPPVGDLGNDDNAVFSNSFNESLSYLQSLSNSRQTAKRNNGAKTTQSAQQQPVAQFTPLIESVAPATASATFAAPAFAAPAFAAPAFAAPAFAAPALVDSAELQQTMRPEINVDVPCSFDDDNASQSYSSISLNSEPVWGCLKNGSKPTFRTLHNPNNTTLKAVSAMPFTDTAAAAASAAAAAATDNEISTATNDAIDTTYGTRKQRLDEYKRDHVQTSIKNQQPNIKIRETKQQIITKKYKLGKYTNKNGPVIGVLIKNRQTQYNVEKKRNEMKHIPLHTIKARLHKKNLLKVGSIAPPDVLRELYETAVFAGDIEYENEGTLLHNFLTSSPDNESGSS
jgi:hypothetical protein